MFSLKKNKKKAEISRSKRKVKPSENWLELEGELVIDVFETSKELVIQAAVAGVKSKELEIIIEDDILKIKGRREQPAEKEKRSYFIKECFWGGFFREIILPIEVNKSKIEAKIEKGVLTIRLPKKRKTEEKKIIIKSV